MRPHRLPLLLLAPLLSAGSVVTSMGPALPADAAVPRIVTIKGPDVSAYQHPDGASIDWAKVAAAGHAFAIVKATEGTSYVNRYFAKDYAGIRTAGMVRGSYHFARPALPVASSALVQAQFYAAHLGRTDLTRTLPPALDLEESGGLTPPQLVTWAEDFLLDVRALTGRTPIVYTYPWFWQNAVADPSAFARYPLWMAAYHGTTPDAGATLWQYTAGATVSGIKGSVDMSRLLADPTTWTALSDGSTPTAWPATVPAAPPAVAVTPGVGAVAVSWMPPDAGSSPISSYRATVTRTDGAEPARVVRAAPSTARVRVAGLTPGASYAVSMQAANAVGTGAAAAAAPVVVLAPTQLSAGPGPVVRYGDPVAVHAALSSNGTALRGATVVVAHRPQATTRWTDVATEVTDGSGAVTDGFAADRNTDVRFTYAGGVGLARSSVVVPVAVRKLVTAAFATTNTTVGSPVVLRGRVNPVEAGTRTAIQLLVAGAWKNVHVTRTGPRGGFRFVVTPSAVGTSTWRVVVGTTTTRAAGFATLTLQSS